jgi:hypothetical protein
MVNGSKTVAGVPNAWANVGLLVCLLFFGNVCDAQTNSEEANGKPVGKSVGVWTAYVDAIGKQDAEAWIAAEKRDADNQLHDFQEVNAQLTQEDWTSLLASKESGSLPRKSALSIFRLESLDSMEFVKHAQFTAKVVWVPLEGDKPTNGIELVLLNPSDVDWTTRVHYFQKGCYLGFQDVYHKYGIRAGNFADGKGVEGVFHNVNQESGTGVWQHALMFYSAANGHLIPAGWIPEKVNLANPCVYNRQLEGKIVNYNPLTVRYEWTIELGYRYRGNQPTFKGKTDVVYTANLETGVLEPQFKSTNLNAEKLLAFDLGASKKLFLHAWNKELLTILKGKDSIKRKAVIEFLEDEYSE